MATGNKNLKVLILSGDGINCEQETAQAFHLVGFQPEIVHINDCIERRLTTQELGQNYSVLALPGGFSFGDDLTSGKILALKISHLLAWDLNAFAQHGGLVLGVCNGFQALIKLGVFGKSVSISSNIQGKFINDWVAVAPHGTRCIWLKGLGTVVIPARHGEGRIVFERSSANEARMKIERNSMDCLKYVNNPNGSEGDVAGLCDMTGRILGVMPHPEAFVRWSAHPNWTRQIARAGAPGEGLKIFENAFEAVGGIR